MVDKDYYKRVITHGKQLLFLGSTRLGSRYFFPEERQTLPKAKFIVSKPHLVNLLLFLAFPIPFYLISTLNFPTLLILFWLV